MILYDYVTDRYGSTPTTFRSLDEFQQAMRITFGEPVSLRFLRSRGGRREWHDSSGVVLVEREVFTTQGIERLRRALDAVRDRAKDFEANCDPKEYGYDADDLVYAAQVIEHVLEAHGWDDKEKDPDPLVVRKADGVR